MTGMNLTILVEQPVDVLKQECTNGHCKMHSDVQFGILRLSVNLHHMKICEQSVQIRMQKVLTDTSTVVHVVR